MDNFVATFRELIASLAASWNMRYEVFMFATVRKFMFEACWKQRSYAIFVFTFFVFLSSPSILAQESIADLVTRIKPSVVKIIVYDEQGKQIATASGFFITQTKVMTNKHVVAGAKSIGIKMFDGSLMYAYKVQDVPDIDIAVLEVKSEGKTIKPLSIAASSPREGDKIVVVGSPLGLEGTVSDGIVSAIRKTVKGTYLQITAPISPGSSGSPVVDKSGRVVGIATLNIEGGQNLNFAIPAQQVASFWINQVSGDSPEANNPPKQEAPKQSEIDLTGNWKSLMSNEPYQIIDDGKKLSIKMFGIGYIDDDYDAKWVGDVVIGYHNSNYSFYQWFFIIKLLDSDKIGIWRVGTLRPTDSDENILKKLMKKARGKPEDILKRTR